MAGHALAEHPHQQVPDPPGDGGDRSGIGLGELEVDHQVAGARGHGRAGLGPGPDAPASRNGLPEVLVVGETVEPRPEVHVPVPAELLGQLHRPVQAHARPPLLSSSRRLSRLGATLGTIADSQGPRDRDVPARLAPRNLPGVAQRSWSRGDQDGPMTTPAPHAAVESVKDRRGRRQRRQRRGRERRDRRRRRRPSGHARHVRPAPPPPPRRSLPQDLAPHHRRPRLDRRHPRRRPAAGGSARRCERGAGARAPGPQGASAPAGRRARPRWPRSSP